MPGFPAEPFKPFKPFKTFFFQANLFFQQKNLLKPFKPFFLGKSKIFIYIFIKKIEFIICYKIDCSKILLAPSALASHQHTIQKIAVPSSALGYELIIGMFCYEEPSLIGSVSILDQVISVKKSGNSKLTGDWSP